jgi:hypothetical protein
MLNRDCLVILWTIKWKVPPLTSEKRRKPRYTILSDRIHIHVLVESGPKKPRLCLVKDISPFGIGLLTPMYMGPATEVALRPESNHANAEVLRVRGYVVWCNSIDDKSTRFYEIYPYGVGIAYNPTDSESALAIYKAIRDSAAKP